MYHRILEISSILIIMAISLFVAGPATAETPVAGSYAGGNGTEGNPYQISNLAELRRFSETEADWAEGTYFILTADIDATDTSTWNIGNHDDDDGTTPEEAMGFSPIGYGDDIYVESLFAGNFNGQDYVITNLTINRPGYDEIGLFGFTIFSGNISNVGIEGGNINGYNHVGGLIGYNAGSSVTSCHASLTVAGAKHVGGLVGYNYYAPITSSYATGSVSATDADSNAGGLAGRSDSSTIESCYATGNVTAQGYRNGGLIGFSGYGSVTSCYATGNVTSPSREAGGLIGYNIDNDITSCKASGNVLGISTVGGLVGISDYSDIDSSSATGTVTAVGDDTYDGDQVGGFIGLTGSDDTISNSFSTGTVSGESYIGGFIGYNFCAITSSYSTASVSATEDWVGGFIGFQHGNDDITSCYATGTVSSAGDKVGGFVGRINGGVVISSYATGKVIATGDHIGGFVGENLNQWGTFTSCYWDLDTSGQTISDGGTGLTSAQMKLEASYDANWDFTTTPDWAIIEGETRPYLPWQTAALFEGTATPEESGFTLDTGYVHNVDGSGVTLDEYGIVCREDGSSDLTFYNLANGALLETESASLDGELIQNTAYWYRAYALDSNGTIHYGTERAITTGLLAVVYVDFDNGSPNGTGTEIDPVDSLSDAVILALENGLIKIAPGTTTETIIIDQPVTLKRNGESGSVFIGN